MKFAMILLCTLLYLIPNVKAECQNSRTYLLNNDPTKHCRWIRFKETRRQYHCKNNIEVQLECPQSCGTCCEDNPDYYFDTPWKTGANCIWLARRQSRQDRWCNTFLGDRMVRDGCPVTCDYCVSEVQLTTNEPSAAPSQVPSCQPSISHCHNSKV